MRGLYLSENKLEGKIPESICDYSNLEALFIDENQLSGSLPSCLGNLENLKQFYAFKNNLSGEVPVELSSLRQLSKLKSRIIMIQAALHPKTLTFFWVPFSRQTDLELSIMVLLGMCRPNFAKRPRPKIFGPIVEATHQNWRVPAARFAALQTNAYKRWNGLTLDRYCFEWVSRE